MVYIGLTRYISDAMLLMPKTILGHYAFECKGIVMTLEATAALVPAWGRLELRPAPRGRR
jgi:hypothetical protein